MVKNKIDEYLEKLEELGSLDERSSLREHEDLQNRLDVIWYSMTQLETNEALFRLQELHRDF